MIYLGADHAGFELKEKVKRYLLQQGTKVTDLGAFSEVASDHPDYAFAVAKKVARSHGKDQGILICGTGVGMAIAANRVRGVRAVNNYDPKIVRESRLHNDANILSLGGRFETWSVVKKSIEFFLTTKPLAITRYRRRIKKYDHGLR